MLADLGITHFYGDEVPDRECKIKSTPEDFVVWERQNNYICAFGPILNLDEYCRSEAAYASIPESASKEDRKKVYDSVKYFPFKRLSSADGKFVVESTMKDIFVFTVMKKNMNTNNVVTALSKCLNIDPRNVNYCGNKDKMAVTFQEFSVQCSFDKLFNYALALSKNEDLHIKSCGYYEGAEEINCRAADAVSAYIEIQEIDVCESFCICNIRKGSSKRLGENTGNRFKIRLRGLETLDKEPSHFLNYFGIQRFGMHRNNHLIGEMLLQKRNAEAIDTILMGGNSPTKSLQGVEEGNGTNNGVLCIDEIKPKGALEWFVYTKKKQGASNDEIIAKMGRTHKMMFMHAYQSHKFNKELNCRYEAKKAFPGDQILKGGEMMDAGDDASWEDIYIPLEKADNKFMRGGYRKAVQELEDFVWTRDEDGITIEFSLGRSCYATSALREIIGNFYQGQNENKEFEDI